MANNFWSLMRNLDSPKRAERVSRRSSSLSLTVTALIVFVFALPQVVTAKESAANQHWVGTWSASPVSEGEAFENQTVRQIVHISIGGDRLRVRFSNRFGTEPLVIDAASIGVQYLDDAVDPGTLRVLTFGGATSIAIAAGAKVLSDPVDLTVNDAADLAISLYVSENTGGSTRHDLAWQTSYISSGNQTLEEHMDGEVKTTSWYWLTGVEVQAHRNTFAVATLGDSITEGCCDFANVDTNQRYPDFLAQRLLDRYPGEVQAAVLNAGISGNRILNDSFGPNAQVRLDPDVLTQSGVTHVILLEGINDIGFSEFLGPAEEVSADEIIAGYKQIIERVHTLGLKIFVGTLLPYYNALYFSPAGEDKRQAVNEWIRTSNSHDGVIDFDEVMRDPSQPGPYPSLLPAYDSGDNLHPSAAGYEAMSNAVDLKLFKQGWPNN
jgi:lysophospholipase L1-like esterase